MSTIKPKNRGLLHKNLGVAQGKKLTMKELQKAKNSKSLAIRKRAQYAINMRKSH